METETLEISVIVASDFEAGEVKSWKDEILIAQSIRDQDIDVPFEVLFVESANNQHITIPDELYAALPNAKVVFVDSTRSAKMKDFGVSLAKGEWVAVMEADCLPETDWLRQFYLAACDNPHVDAVSGRTFYGKDSSYKRVMTLLDRSFNDSACLVTLVLFRITVLCVVAQCCRLITFQIRRAPFYLPDCAISDCTTMDTAFILPVTP